MADTVAPIRSYLPPGIPAPLVQRALMVWTNLFGLVSFEHKETVHSGDTGESHVICAYLVNHAGHVGARTQLAYRDPALR